MSEIGLRSATELLAALGRKEISSRELLEHYLDRVDTLNPRINAVVTVDAEAARQRADAADAARARGEVWGPLHGLPMTLKDTFETAGVRTTAGAPVLANHVPVADAVAVARLKAAGAIVFGKSNTPIYAGDTQTYNEVFGTTRNPWNLERSPGGSSGGSAAAMSAGLSAMELGSDIGGSIRNPSHYCGVYGHKASFGVVPTRGHIPGPPGSLNRVDMNVAGPIGRAPEDLALAMQSLAGPLADEDGIAWKLSLPPARHARLRDYRVGVWLDDPLVRLDDEMRAILQRAVDEVRSGKAKVDQTARPGFALAEAYELYRRLLTPVIASGFPAPLLQQFAEMARSPQATNEDDVIRFARSSVMRHIDWLQVTEARQQLRARWATFFQDYDVLLCPVTATPAIEHDHSEPLAGRSVMVNGQPQPYLTTTIAWNGSIGNMCYLPATVAPVGRTSAGLPVGIQIVGPYLEDNTCIAFATRLRDVVGGFEAPPGFA